jgi:hypothetical protein
MTLQDWITKYEQEAEEFILLPGFSIYYRPEKGFFCWRIWRDVFEIDHTCTIDIKWADDKISELAKQHNCTILRTATFRDPAAYMRFRKATPNIAMSGLRPNNKFYWVFERKVI